MATRTLAMCALLAGAAARTAPAPSRYPRPATYDTSARRKEGTAAAPVVNVHLVPHTHDGEGASARQRWRRRRQRLDRNGRCGVG